MANNVAVSFSLIDNFTGPMNDAIQSMMKSSKNIQSLVKDVLKGNKVFEDAGKIVEDALNSPFAKTGKEVYDLATIYNDAANDIKSGFMDKIGKFNTIASFIKNIKELSGTMKGTAKAADGLGNINQINTIIINVSNTIFNATGKVDNFNKAGKNLSNTGKGISKLGGVFTKLGSTFGNFGKIGKVALMGLKSPAFIAIAIIAVLATIVFVIIKNWGTIKPFLNNIANFFKQKFNSIKLVVLVFVNEFKKAKNSIAGVINVLGPIIYNIIKIFNPVLVYIISIFVKRIRNSFLIIKAVFSAVIRGIRGSISGLLSLFNGIIILISGGFTNNWYKVWDGVRLIFKGVFESFSSLAKIPINAVIQLINLAISGINKLGIKLPDWLGGKSFSINIPTIPMLAKGTNYWQGGPAMIHDRGAEIVDLPRGSRVYPHDKSIQMARAEGTKGKGNVAITIAKLADKIEVRSDKDIDDIVNKVANKFEKILNNTGEVVLA
ncbi:hypothetical protein EDD66_105305 [Mobilisporobacter senegalensis]|uniref:Phage-related protein n=1 Tax=Mobilisporobacter senegalensis TaxID=1329262 RepID=A0A3N1XNV6_9FIRM|nr:hypothetical protein [Mobilisporobacter senegalensis]ROR28363.1 hypothetical protein EDD66_105305 [Mobilisporobacter senegalensis]